MPGIPRLLFRFHHLRQTLLAGIVALLTAQAPADSPFLIDLWTPYEGLPQSRVLGIAQTPDGYLWVSTQLGWFARFDGIQFDHFNPNNTPALLSPEIQKLIVDDRGVLWICDVDGRLISYSDGVFRNTTTAKPGYDKRVTGWIGRHGNENRFFTAAGMLLRSGDQTIYENENNPPMQAPEAIRQFCQDKDGTLWCRTHGGAFGRWVDGALQPVTPDPLPAGTKVGQLLPMPDGGLWIATNDGLWTYRKPSPFPNSARTSRRTRSPSINSHSIPMAVSGYSPAATSRCCGMAPSSAPPDSSASALLPRALRMKSTPTPTAAPGS